MTRSFPGPVAIAALLAAAWPAALAPAAPHTEHFVAVDAEAVARLEVLGDGVTRRERRQARALRRSLARIARESVTLRQDVGTARQAERWITRRFPDDGPFGLLFDGLTETLRIETLLRHQAVSDELDARLGVRPLVRAQRASGRAAEFLTRADAATTRRAALSLLRRALDRLRRADAALIAHGLPSAQVALRAPIGAIVAAGITESSGVAILRGAYWTHNDSGGGATLFRSGDPTFTDAEALPLPGATNVDWEDITTLDGDLIVCDVGDNARVRDDYVLYRARYVAADAAPARLDLVATYPLAYPDGRHDCEAAAVIDGHVVLVIKQSDEADTGVYRFDTLVDAADLPPGTVNVPERIAGLTLSLAEQVTGATVYRGRGSLVLLTYFNVLTYELDDLAGGPSRVVPLSILDTKQAEGIAFAGDRLLITNEQRDVFGVHDFLTRD